MCSSRSVRANQSAAGSAPALLPLVVCLGFLGALGFLGLSGCQPEGGSGGALRIAVIPKGTTHEFWKMVHAGAIKAEREINAGSGPKIEVIWKGPQKEDDRSQQIQVVQNFIASRVAGICLAPLDDTALREPVEAATKAGVPVVIVDSGLEGEPGKDYVAYVATKNYDGGVLGARRLAEVLGGKGKVILLRYQEGSASTMLREQGFLDTLKKEFPGIELISSQMYAGPTTESGYQKAQNLITRFRDEVDGIFCPNESSTFGMLRALDDADMLGKVKFVGFDASEDIVRAVRAGHIDGVVLQHPIDMCYIAVKTLYAHLQGEKVDPEVGTPVSVVTPENVDTPENKLLHSPDLSQWLGS